MTISERLAEAIIHIDNALVYLVHVKPFSTVLMIFDAFNGGAAVEWVGPGLIGLIVVWLNDGQSCRQLVRGVGHFAFLFSFKDCLVHLYPHQILLIAQYFRFVFQMSSNLK